MTLPADPLRWAVDAFKDGRNAVYGEYRDYLDGKQPLAFATDKFLSAFGRTFEAFAYNRCETVVDAHADRMQVTGFGADDDALSQLAQGIWDQNRMDVREGHFEVDAFGLGDGYTIVEVHPSSGAIHIWIQSPDNVRVHYSDEVPGQRDLAVKTWLDDDKYQHLNLYFGDRIEKYISKNRAPGGIPVSSGSFERYEVDGEEWGFRTNAPGVVPVFPFANNGRTNSYGRSELRPVLPLQDALNKAILDKMVAMEFAAFPQKVILGLDESPNAETQDALQRFEAGLTRILALYGENAKIGEFSAANIAQYIAVADFFDTTISRVTKVPVHYLSMSGDFPSGRALRIAETPFIKKMLDRQRAFGNVIADMMTYCLHLSGKNVADGALRVNWESPAPMSEEDVWDLVQQKRDAGMALVSALREAGYDPDQITAIQEESAQAADVARAMFDRGDDPDDVPADEDADEDEEAA